MEDRSLGIPVSGRRLYSENPRVQSPNNRLNQESVTRNFLFQDPSSVDYGRRFSMNRDQDSESSGSWFNGFHLQPDPSWALPGGNLETALGRLNLSTPPLQPQFRAPVSPLRDADGIDALLRHLYDDCPLQMGGGFYQSPNPQESLRTMRIEAAVRGQTLRGDHYMRPNVASPLNNNDVLVPPNSPFSYHPSMGQSLGASMNGTASSGSDIRNGFDWNCRRQSSPRTSYHHFPRMPSSTRTGTRQDSNFQSWGTSHDDLRPNGFTSLPPLQQLSTLSPCEEWMDLLRLKTNGFSPRRRETREPEERQVDPSRFLQLAEDGIYGFDKLLEDHIPGVLGALISNEQRLKRMCTNKAGSLSVQRFVDHIKTPELRYSLVSALRKLTVVLSNCLNGQHVIYKLFQAFSHEDNKPILHEVVENCVEIATDQTGCCTMQGCVEYAVGQAKQHLIAKITENALLLSQHPYGNFVVQQIMGLEMRNVGAAIMNRLQGSFVTLSMDKFGSHVSEKCLKEFGGEFCPMIICELVSNSDTFLNIIQDKYGNYVVQSALEASKGLVHQTLVEHIEYHSKSLESHPCGKMVLARAKGYKRHK